MKLYFILMVVFLTGCGYHSLTNREKYEASKQCTDAGMWPLVQNTTVQCFAVPKNEVIDKE